MNPLLNSQAYSYMYSESMSTTIHTQSPPHHIFCHVQTHTHNAFQYIWKSIANINACNTHSTIASEKLSREELSRISIIIIEREHFALAEC